jgi:hypothetical protein
MDIWLMDTKYKIKIGAEMITGQINKQFLSLVVKQFLFVMLSTTWGIWGHFNLIAFEIILS